MSDLRNKIVHAMLKEGAARKSLSDRWDRMADAAIALVLEEAAKVALILEEERVGIPCPDGIKGCAVFHFRREQRPRTPLEIAAAIRALKEKA